MVASQVCLIFAISVLSCPTTRSRSKSMGNLLCGVHISSSSGDRVAGWSFAVGQLKNEVTNITRHCLSWTWNGLGWVDLDLKIHNPFLNIIKTIKISFKVMLTPRGVYCFQFSRLNIWRQLPRDYWASAASDSRSSEFNISGSRLQGGDCLFRLELTRDLS